MGKDKLMVSALVTGKRQITIPKEVCEYFNIRVGDKVIFREKDDSIIFERDSSIDRCSLEMDEAFKFNFIIPFHLLSDALTMGQLHIIDEVFKKAEEAVISGGKVIVQQEYVNAKPQIMKAYESVEELNKFKKDFLATKSIT